MQVYNIIWDNAVAKDIKKLKLTKIQIAKLRDKVSLIAKNPLPKARGGYGEPLAKELSDYLKFRFDGDYRVGYKLKEENSVMTIIIIGLRKDSNIYTELQKRISK